jgi:type IV secretory pathway VirB4 component
MKKALLGKKNNAKFEISFQAFKKHFIALGGSGSGKTVLCKTIIEEAILNKIPAVIVDPQGDIASLSLLSKDASSEFKEAFQKTKITIFTPTSSKGIPLCINPLKLPDKELDKETVISILHQISSSLAKLIGYELGSDKGKGAQVAIYKILMHAFRKREELSSFTALADKLDNLPEAQKKEINEFISDNELRSLEGTPLPVWSSP